MNLVLLRGPVPAPSRVKRDNVTDLNRGVNRVNLKSSECYLEHTGDSGAGKIWSERAFEEQGIPRSWWTSCIDPASVSVHFDTGGGFQGATESVDVVSPPLGRQEAYRLGNAGCASCMGQVAIDAEQPCAWVK
eukprot:12268797-Karenia_brevis.AAC.1